MLRPGLPLAAGDLEDRAQQIRERLVGTEDPEIPLVLIEHGHVTQELAEHQRVLGGDGAGRWHVHGVHAEVRHAQVAEQDAAVGVRIGAHPPVPLGGQLGQVRHEAAVGIEQLLRPVALHPVFQLPDVLEVIGVDQQRHLVGPERALDLQAVDDFRARPALGRLQHDHRPAPPGRVAGAARMVLHAADALDGLFQRAGHELVHLLRVVTLDEQGLPAAAAQELVQFLVLDAGQDGGVADLVAVEVQDRQHGPVADRAEELVGLPRGGQRAGLGLAVTDDAGDDQARIVERGPEGMAERVTQLTAFVDRPRRRGRDVAGDPAGKRELGEQLLQPGFILADVRIDLAVGALEVGIAHQRRAAVTGTGDIEHIQVILLDDPVQVNVDEILARCRAPVPDHKRFHMRQFEWLFQQRIVVEVELADR